MSDERKIGLFLDFENIILGLRTDSKVKESEIDFHIDLILDRLLEKGRIVVKKAYCDWSRYRSHKDALHEAAFELIDIPKKRVTGKNSADIRMVVDVMDLSASKEHVDTFCLVTGDSDFSPLVSKLKENDKSVIGVGVRDSVSQLLAENCDEFLYYEDLVKDRETRKQRSRSSSRTKKLKPKEAEAFALITDTVAGLSREGYTRIYASMVKQTIKRKNPGFSETSYDFDSFSKLLRGAETAGLLKLEEDTKSGSYLVELAQQD